MLGGAAANDVISRPAGCWLAGWLVAIYKALGPVVVRHTIGWSVGRGSPHAVPRRSSDVSRGGRPELRGRQSQSTANLGKFCTSSLFHHHGRFIASSFVLFGLLCGAGLADNVRSWRYRKTPTRT